MRYPVSTGTEHLFEAGIWIGAVANGSQITISSSAVTNPSGYSRGRAGYEFTADREIRFEGEETGLGVSEQDIIADFTDRRRQIDGIPINGHDFPLFADIRLESYNWGFPFTENFSILKYEITNNSEDFGAPVVWDSVYVGMYADIVVRNVNTTTETGGDFFNKNGIGYLDSLYTTYAFDAGSNDNPSINTYGAVSIIGAEYEGDFYHPINREFLESQGKQVPDVGPSYWLFAAGTGVFQGPADDIDRYTRMTQEFPLDEPTLTTTDPANFTYRDALRTDGQDSQGNYISLVKIGPFPRIEPGETFVVYFAYSAALKPEQFQGQAGKRVDNEESRVNLVNTLNSIYRVFQGEDQNNNGVLDGGEDTNENGVLDRYLFPTPPDNPNVRVSLSAGRASIYWDRSAEFSVDRVSGEQDFEGYRIYSTDLGDDLNPTPRLIQEFDNTGNDIGFNTGFNAVRLDQPVTFEGDTTEYWYRYDIDGLLSGWQYQISVTAFDRGSDQFEIQSLESSQNTNAVRIFPGTPANENFGSSAEEYEVGVYPNPYRVNAAWDGANENERKLYFYNLPERAEVRIYTISGDIVAELEHNASTYNGDIDWFENFSDTPRILPGGEHAWDLQSDANQILTTGLYLYSVKDLSTGKVQTGKLVIIK